MTTKEKLLTLFEEHRGEFISGEEIANTLNISRSAIWKTVKKLRDEGYKIDAVTNKGYSLAISTDKISKVGVEKYLKENNIKLTVLDTVNSTNAYLRNMANSGEGEGRVVISTEQTEGRGRFTRKFYSPKDSGIYLSLLLRPTQLSPKDATRITTVAAVAMCEAIESVSNRKPQIKWVNDVFLDGKKVCGILTEASFDMESGTLDYAVLGVGLNVYTPKGGFPDDIKNIATALFDEQQEDAKNKIIANFLNNFYTYYNESNFKIYTDKYREYSFVIGREVVLRVNNEEIPAKVLDIDDECRLVVKTESGEEKTISYGEISVKI